MMMEWLRHHDRYEDRPVIPVRGLSRLILLAVLLPLVAGCAGSTASPSTSPSAVSRDEQYCVRYGGIWHPNLGVCESDIMP
jgi:hypothetical protein